MHIELIICSVYVVYMLYGLIFDLLLIEFNKYSNQPLIHLVFCMYI